MVPNFDTPDIDSPEIFIPSVKAPEVIEKTIEISTEDGGTAIKVNDYQVVFSFPGTQSQNTYFGSIFNPKVRQLISYSIFQTEAGVRVTGRLKILMNPGGDIERVRDVTYAHTDVVNHMLMDIKRAFPEKG